MAKMLNAVWLALQEGLSATTLRRQPEPSAAMSDLSSVRGFHDAGGPDGPLQGVYDFNARAVHSLVPRAGTVLDLGCGSGRFLAYLAIRRPDLTLIGLDVSPEMVSLGNELLRAVGLTDRVQLRDGDMTNFGDSLPPRLDLISTVFSLHHLPTHAHLDACVHEIGRAILHTDANFWLFDHARPRRESTAIHFPEVFTPEASTAFKLDSCNSLRASWSFDELRRALADGVTTPIESSLARLLPLYQIHWREKPQRVADATLWNATARLSARALADTRALASLFKRQPDG